MKKICTLLIYLLTLQHHKPNLQIIKRFIMKKILLSIVALFVATVSFAGDGTAANPYTIAEINAIAATLENKQVSEEAYYFKGIVSSVKEISTQYGNATFYLSDNGEKQDEFYVYRCKGLNNENITSTDLLKEGDIVTVCGKITNYNGTLETSQNNAYIVEVVDGGQETVDIANTPETAYTVSEACDLIDAGKGLATPVYVKGTVKAEGLSISVSYGNADYFITDGAKEIKVFRGYYFDGEKFTSTDQLKAGDEVVVYGALTLYGETYEINSGNKIYSINGETEAPEVEPEDYTFVGDGTLANAYTADDVKHLLDAADCPTEAVWVKGEIVGCAASGSNLTTEDKIQASNIAVGTADSWVPVQLPANTAVREVLNLLDNPGNAGKNVWVLGTIEKYFSVAGVKNVSDYSFDGVTTDIKNVAVDANAPVYNLAGQRVADNYRGVVIMNGKKVIK